MQTNSATALVAACLLWPRLCAADGYPMTRQRIAEVVRERAPVVVSAQGRVAEAQARLPWASALLRSNPVVETSAGHRGGAIGVGALEARIAIRQSFEIGGQRAARIAGAQAGIARVAALAQDVERQLLRDGLLAYQQVLYAQERYRLTVAAEAVAKEVTQVAERRAKSGDAALLDIQLARAAQARACSDSRFAEANRTKAVGSFRAVLGLGLETALEFGGELRDRRSYVLKAMEAQAAQRPDLAALEAEFREAQADRRLGEAMQWPDLGIGASFERTDSANVALGTLALALPLVDVGQELRAEGAARERRVSGELAAARKSVLAEVHAAYAVYQQRVAAAAEYERDTLALLDQNEVQIRRSFELGRLPMSELLALRREIIAMRVEYLDRLLQAAQAATELEASAGFRN